MEDLCLQQHSVGRRESERLAMEEWGGRQLAGRVREREGRAGSGASPGKERSFVSEARQNL